MSNTIGAKALYLLIVWLLSAAGGAWVAERKGYAERVGLTFGLILTAAGFLIVLLLPARPGSTWRIDGPLPKRGGGRAGGARAARGDGAGLGPALVKADPPPASDREPGAETDGPAGPGDD